ncbi:hypothetical protein HDU79_012069, partial [Rhizoclosmatium sp. JEL0117]
MLSRMMDQPFTSYLGDENSGIPSFPNQNLPPHSWQQPQSLPPHSFQPNGAGTSFGDGSVSSNHNHHNQQQQVAPPPVPLSRTILRPVDQNRDEGDAGVWKASIRHATKQCGHGPEVKQYGAFNFRNVISKIRNAALKTRLQAMDPTSDNYGAMRSAARNWHTYVRENMSKKCFGQYGEGKAAERVPKIRLRLFAGLLWPGRSVGETELRRAALMRYVRFHHFDPESNVSRKGFWKKLNTELVRVDSMASEAKERYFMELIRTDEANFTELLEENEANEANS